MKNSHFMQLFEYMNRYMCWINPIVKVFIVTTAMLTLTRSHAQCPQECINFNTLFGKDAGDPMMGGKSNSFFGQNAGKNNSTGDANSFFGQDAGLSNTVGDSNSFFGFGAGSLNTTGYFNSFFGKEAGFSNTLGRFNSFFGKDAGSSNTTGSFNSFFGKEAGSSNTTGSLNSFFGEDAGEFNTNGLNNSFFGKDAGKNNTTGSNNSFFGRNAGDANRIGTNNSFYGRDAGEVAQGDSNSFFGYRAGGQVTTGNYVVSIGANSGPQSNVSNRLYIDVQRSNDPLIYGEFDNDFVRINGTFEVTAGLANPSSITLKDHFVPVDRMEVLDKVSQLDIQEWSYKQDPQVRHIGPIAEAFYAAFHLGQGSKTISTIDADGVALMAIQALKEQVDALKEVNHTLRNDHLEMQRVMQSLVVRMEKMEGGRSE